jgi:hypothetical protein
MAPDKSIPALVRLQPELADRIDAWRRQQADLPTRPEAIRRLVELALAPRAAAPLASAPADNPIDPRKVQTRLAVELASLPESALGEIIRHVVPTETLKSILDAPTPPTSKRAKR